MENTAIPEKFYFHGNEMDQFIHIQVPIVLVKEKEFRGISASAMILYGLLLNRTGLSIRNGWLDENNRTYIIYTIENVKADLGIGKTKAINLFNELSNINGTGIGLIKKVRMINKPSRIYVMNFMEVYRYLSNANVDVNEEEHRDKNVDKNVDNNVDNCCLEAKETSDDRKCEPPSTANADTNNNYIINKDINNIDYININHINLSEDTDELSTYARHSTNRIDGQRKA